MKNILVTGGAGFIGSNFIKYMLNKYNYNIINLDALTYAGNIQNLIEVVKKENYVFIKGDIRDRNLVDSIFKKYNITNVINFAAESHVDRSIEEPENFLSTNILGTQVLLDVAKDNWKENANDKYNNVYKKNVKFIQISTDEVYGQLGVEGKFTEENNLVPNSPYSASKASADLIVRAYNKTFGLPINITRCSNNYGPNQFPEKLIPLIIYNCKSNKPIPIYGDGSQIRDWIHVNDHCSGIDSVLHNGQIGEVYNIGGNNEWKNIDIAKFIIKRMGKKEELIQFVKDRPGHDKRYSIDNKKIIRDLGWKPQYTFEKGINETINWYIDNNDWMEKVINKEYLEYYDKMYNNITLKNN